MKLMNSGNYRPNDVDL